MTDKPIRPDTQDESKSIPEVVPERHILPEMPDEQEAFLKGSPKSEAPTAAEIALSADEITEDTELVPPSEPATPEPPRFIEPGEILPKVSKPAAKPGAKPAVARHPAPKIVLPPQQRGRKERYTLVMVVSTLRSLIVTFAAAVIVATIFMWWTSPDFLPVQARIGLAPVQATARQISATRTALPTPVWFNRVGVLAGHTGIAKRGKITEGVPDPGAICPDGFFERSVTENVSAQVVALLRGRGFTVDLLEEWDMRLFDYQAAAFISFHADSCDNFGYGGFKSAYPAERTVIRELDRRLDECIRTNYEAITGLTFRPDNITDNMRLYHAFREIAPTTPAVILELGFLSYDRDLLQNKTDKVALGIVNGLMCFLSPDSLATQAAAPMQVSTPTPFPFSIVPTPTTP